MSHVYAVVRPMSLPSKLLLSLSYFLIDDASTTCGSLTRLNLDITKILKLQFSLDLFYVNVVSCYILRPINCSITMQFNALQHASFRVT
jgi:hypothetical protein